MQVQLELAQARTDMARRKALDDELVALNVELGKKLAVADRIAVEQEKTSVLAALDQLGKAEVAKRKQTAAAALKATQTKIGQQAERILGLGVGGQRQPPGAQALRARERKILTGALERAGVDVSKTADMSVDKLVRSMERLGVEMPAATLDSLEKINRVLKLKFLPPDVRENLRARLAQIQQTLKTGAGLSTYHAVHTSDLVKGLGLDRTQSLRLRERLAVAEAHKFMVPAGPAAAGVPLTAAFTPAGQHVVVHVGGITVNGTGRNTKELAKELAHEIQAELLKVGRRNPVQTRGPTAGRSAGLG